MQDPEPGAFERVAALRHRLYQSLTEGGEGLDTPWARRDGLCDAPQFAFKTSHDNDLRDYWKFRARQERGRLYGHKPKYKPMPRLRRVA